MDKLSILLLFSTFVFFQCDTDDPAPVYTKIVIDTDNDFLIFGSTYGECMGDCSDLYMLTRDALHKDASSEGQDDLRSTVFERDPLTLGQFLDAFILQDIPEVIINSNFEEDELIDYIPDFEYYIYGQRDGVQFTFTYDAIEVEASSQLRTFAKNVQEVLEKLGN